MPSRSGIGKRGYPMRERAYELGECRCSKKPTSVAAAHESRMLTHDLAEASAQIPRPGMYYPDPVVGIFENDADSTQDMVLDFVIFPTLETCSCSDPEGSVRRTERGDDGRT